jgi:hypothetical protein
MVHSTHAVIAGSDGDEATQIAFRGKILDTRVLDTRTIDLSVARVRLVINLS